MHQTQFQSPRPPHADRPGSPTIGRLASLAGGLMVAVVAAMPMSGPATAQDTTKKKTKPGEGGWYDLRGIEVPVIYSDRLIRKRKLEIAREQPFRLMQFEGEKVLAEIKRPVYYFEWDHIKFVAQFPSVNLAVEMAPKTLEERRNWEFLKHEIDDLKRVFPRARVGTLNGHQVAHLVMNRLVRFYKKFEREMRFWDEFKGVKLEDYGMGPHLGQRGRYEIYVIKDKRSFYKWEDRFIGRKSIVGQKWNLMEDNALSFCCYYIGPFPRFNNFLHHNFAQLLIWGYRHWSFKLPGWLQMGFGHYIERQITPRYNSFDYDEGGAKDIPKTWRWKKDIRKQVLSKKYRPFAEMKAWIEPSEFDGDDFQQCWSMIDFLIAHDKIRFREFVNLVSKKVRQDDAMKKAYGWSFNLFEERWKDHVVRTYPPR